MINQCKKVFFCIHLHPAVSFLLEGVIQLPDMRLKALNAYFVLKLCFWSQVTRSYPVFVDTKHHELLNLNIEICRLSLNIEICRRHV